MPSGHPPALPLPLSTPLWLRELWSRSPETMAAFDPVSEVFLAGNDAALSDWGIQAGLAAPADGWQALEEAVHLAMQHGSHRFEWLKGAGSSTSRHYDVVITRLPGESGSDFLLLSGRDIDAIKRTELSLRVSEARWRGVFEQSPMSMQVFSPDGSTRQINSAYKELFHFTMEDLKLFNILHDAQLEAAGFGPSIRQAFTGEPSTIPPIPFDVRTQPDQPSNGIRWIGSTMFPVRDPSGEIVEVVCVHADHTARKEAEDELRQLTQSLEQRIEERTAELRQSEERFKLLFEFSPLGIAQVCRDGHFEQINPAFAGLLGYTPEELSKISYWDVAFSSLSGNAPEFLESLNGMDRVGPVEKEYIHRDGRRIPVMLNGMQVVDSGGEVQIWRIIEDITGRRRAEAAQRDSEAKFKALFELSPLGMARVDMEGRFQQVNQSFARMIGYTPEEVTQLTYWDLTPPGYDEQERQVLEMTLKTGRFGPFAKEYIHKDGHFVPIMLNGMMIRGADGKDELWGIAEDITQRRKAENALRKSERKFRTLFEASSQGVMLHEDFLFAEVNPAAARLFGMRPHEFVGKHPAEFAPEFQPNGERSEVVAERRIQECFDYGSSRFEWAHLHTHGHELMLEVLLTRIPDAEKNLMQAVVTDISARKRAEHELKRALERERELHQLKSNFVSMVSHEFRTPLGIIQSSAEILDDYLEQLEPAERAEQLESIIKNSRRMAGLMEDVLLLGRLEAGRMHFMPRALDLAALCRRLVDEILSTTDARCPIEFRTQNLPAETAADERLLRHILLNLLTNAVKYSEMGQTVHFRATADGVNVVFIIQDHGIGIPRDEQEHLFEAFHRGSNVGQRPGTGLGLVIVKQSVELHGGVIEVDSQPGAGTCMRVTIPLTLS